MGATRTPQHFHSLLENVCSSCPGPAVYLVPCGHLGCPHYLEGDKCRCGTEIQHRCVSAVLFKYINIRERLARPPQASKEVPNTGETQVPHSPRPVSDPVPAERPGPLTSTSSPVQAAGPSNLPAGPSNPCHLEFPVQGHPQNWFRLWGSLSGALTWVFRPHGACPERPQSLRELAGKAVKELYEARDTNQLPPEESMEVVPGTPTRPLKRVGSPTAATPKKLRLSLPLAPIVQPSTAGSSSVKQEAVLENNEVVSSKPNTSDSSSVKQEAVLVKNTPAFLELRCSSSLLPDQRRGIVEFLKMARESWTVRPLAVPMTPTTTHLVVPQVEFTSKFYMAAYIGAWVVTYQWVQDSLKDGRVLPEESYAIVKRRPPPPTDLFKSLVFFLSDDIDDKNKKILADLISFVGCRRAPSLKVFLEDVNSKRGLRGILLHDRNIKESRSGDVFQVSCNWFLKSIKERKLRPPVD